MQGNWKHYLNPCSALMELQRIANKNIVIVYNKGIPRSWQSLRMYGGSDWTKINTSAFYCSEKAAEDEIQNLSDKKCTQDPENEELKRKIDKVVKKLSGKSSLGAVIYIARKTDSGEKLHSSA